MMDLFRVVRNSLAKQEFNKVQIISMRERYLEWRVEYASTTGGAKPFVVDLCDVEYETWKSHKPVRHLFETHFPSNLYFWFA